MATSELSNRLLRPLQLVKSELETETSISGIYMLQTQTAVEKLDDGLYELERAVQLEIERREKDERDELERKRKEDEANGKSGDEGEVRENTPKPAPVSKPKPVVEVMVSSVFNKVSESVYLETEADIAAFIDALKDELSAAIAQEKRVRIR